MLRPAALFLATALLAAPTHGQNIEYLPGVEWKEPPVVTPGATDNDPPSDAVVLFDGTDLSAWENTDNWSVEDGAMVSGGGDIFTKEKFGDLQLHIEWASPTKVSGDGQGRGNSGVFLMSTYEVQVLDSFENPTYPEGQAASVYKQTPPMVNVTRKPGEWNNYEIYWTCPRFEQGDLVAPAAVTVVHNGVLVVNHHVLTGDTAWFRPPLYEDQGEKAPIKLQDHGNPVRFRNIWVRELSPPVGESREAMFIDHETGEKWSADRPSADGE